LRLQAFFHSASSDATMRSIIGLSLLTVATADRPADLIDVLPGFNETKESRGFKAYSGMLDVPGPVGNYDSLKIHYQFDTSQSNPASDPVAIWHQGGPGGSSIVGLYLEMGHFQVNADGSTETNPFAWNRVANMLYLESPAGSGQNQGYSQCIRDGAPVRCEWNDRTQAEAYAHTLQAFFGEFPEFAQNDLYLTGESYFGQYGPNIAHFILNNEPFASTLNLKGMALGNACWGGDESRSTCNGPNSQKNDVDFFFGKGLFSPKLHNQIQQECDWTGSGTSSTCQKLIGQMHKEVGPFNIYNVYDNCQATRDFLQRTGTDSAWLMSQLREGLSDPQSKHDELLALNGGFPYHCKSIGGVSNWLVRSDVQEALHLGEPGLSGFRYSNVGPASITLYPELVKKLRILIYNGDADACVPYIGNEEWIGDLEEQGILEETSPWAPWFTSNTATAAGYLTEYKAANSSQTLQFQTIRLAGHMVPYFVPEAAFVMFSDFLKGGSSAHVV